jgi:hypothetical protein
MAQTSFTSSQIRDETLLVDDLKDLSPVDGGGLNLVVKEGRIRKDNVVTSVAEQTISLTNNATNYVEINDTGTATSNTVGFTSGKIPIAIVATSGGSISSIIDKRAWFHFIGSAESSPLTTKGDIHVFGTSDARLPVGSDEQVIHADSSQTLGVKWDYLLRTRKDTTLVEVVNTTSETTIYSFDVPANTLGTNRWIRVSFFGTILNNTTGARDITIRVKYGATTVAQQTITNPGDNVNLFGYKLDVYLAAAGSTNSQKGGFVLKSRALNNDFFMGAHGTASEDSTVTKTLVVTVQFPIAHPNLSFKKESAILQIL